MPQIKVMMYYYIHQSRLPWMILSIYCLLVQLWCLTYYSHGLTGLESKDDNGIGIENKIDKDFYELIYVTGSAKRGLMAFLIACTWQPITSSVIKVPLQNLVTVYP